MIAIRMNAEKLDEILRTYPHPLMIVSEQGVVFASNRPEWIMKLSRNLSPTEMTRLRAEKQFGAKITDLKSIQSLPFSLEGTTTQVDDKTYSITQLPLDWSNAGGRWTLVMLQDTSDWTSVVERFVLSIIILVLAGAFYLIVRLRNRIEQNAIAAVYAQQQIQQKAKLHLRQVTDTLPLAIFQIKLNLNYAHWSFTFASANCRQILGVEPMELMTNYHLLEQRIYPDDADYILDLFNLSLEQKKILNLNTAFYVSNKLCGLKSLLDVIKSMTMNGFGMATGATHLNNTNKLANSKQQKSWRKKRCIPSHCF